MPCTVTVRSVFSIGVTTLAASSDIIILPSLVTGGTITLRTTRNLSCLYDTIPKTQAYLASTHTFLDVFVGFACASAHAKPTKTCITIWGSPQATRLHGNI